MSITNYRFRADDGKVVLQVCEYGDQFTIYNRSGPTWRDAKVEDLLEVAALIRRGSQVDRVCAPQLQEPPKDWI